MKKTIVLFGMMLLINTLVQAQATEKGNVVVTPSIGLGTHGYYSSGAKGFGIPVNLNVDFNVHDYVSVGPYASFYTRKFDSDARYTGVGVGVRGLFHFWQFIADKSGKDLKSDNIDMFVGAGFGYNIGTLKYFDDTKYKDNYLDWGVGAGIRYYFTEKFGVSAEFGYLSNSWLKIGFPIKF
jgi:hypothetical protein